MSAEQTWQVLGGDQEQYGPYTAEQLMAFAQDGTIDRASMVWTEGLEEWIPAGQVEGLFPAEVAAPTVATPQAPQFVLTGQPRPTRVAQPKGVAWATAPAGPPAVEIDQSFGQVVTGFRLVYWGFLANFLASLAQVVLSYVQEDDFTGAGEGLSGVSTVLLLVAVVGYLTEAVGVCLCYKAPRDSTAKGFLTASVVIMVMPFAGILGMFGMFLSVVGVMVTRIGWVLYPLSVLFYVLYMKRLAVLVGKRDLELRAKSFAGYLMFLFGLPALGLILFVVVVVIGGAMTGLIGVLIGGVVGLIGAVVLLVMSIVALFLYLRLLQAFREGIQWEIFRGKSGPGQPTGSSMLLR